MWSQTGFTAHTQRITMSIAVLTLHLHISGCSSLKEKRSHIKPILARLHREFNVAASEVDLQDVWQDAVLACVTISNNTTLNRRLLQQVVEFTAETWPDIDIRDHTIEII